MLKPLLTGLWLLFGMLAGVPLFAQVPFTIPTDSSFYLFSEVMYAVHGNDSTEGGTYNHLRRASMVWAPRTAPTGQMSRVTQARTAYARGYHGLHAGGPYSLPIPPNFPATHPNVDNWDELGPTAPLALATAGSRGMGQIHRVGFHPQYNGTTNQLLYAGSHYGGLFRSDNGGVSWYNYHTDRGLALTSIGGIAVSDTKVFVCTGNGDYAYSNYGRRALYNAQTGNINNFCPLHTIGVYRNTHVAPSSQWVSINGDSVRMIDGTLKNDLLDVFALGGTMRNIIVHPTNDNILLVATSEGIFRTLNGGQFWEQVLVGEPNGSGGYWLDSEWRGLEFHPTDPSIVYASGKDVYRSTDGGATWASTTNYQGLVSDTRRINLAVTPAAPNNLYAYVVRGHESRLYRDDGQGWYLHYTNVDNNMPAWAAVAVSPLYPDIIHMGGVSCVHLKDVYVPSTGTWAPNVVYYSGGIYSDVHFLGYPNNDTTLYAGTHGGVSSAPVGRIGGNWTELYQGLAVSTIWSFDDWEGDAGLIATANQDIGINHTYNKGEIWYGTLGGQDGYGVQIDDHTGLAYSKYNNYRGNEEFFSNPPNLTHFNPIIGGNQTNYALPLDPVDTLGRAFVPNTFPLVNHPKTEVAYVGFSELYRRPRQSILASEVDSFFYNSIVLAQGIMYNRQGAPVYAIGATRDFCYDDFGGIAVGLDTQYIDTTTFYYTFFGITHRVDTLCEIVTKIPDYKALMQPSSDLHQHQPSRWDRRIIELAFSEDEATDYTYLATMGDYQWRRSDFYRGDKATGCDTCFVRLTQNLPYDPTVPNNITKDPNPITGIAVDPLDGNRVWVSFSGHSSALKVWYSDDAGNTWSSYDDPNGSLAALNVPINGIVYQRGTQDRLYIATDVGIYVREAGGDWLRYGENFPNVRVTELKINYCAGKLRAATFGRGVWENDLLPVEEETSYRSFRTVSGTETWTADKNLSRDLRIKSGGMLILNNMTLNMPKGGLIVVEPGAQLIVDSTTITNLCGQTWQGIQVWGQSDQPQNFYHQGQLTVFNSTIEHAREAVSPWEVGNFPRPDGTGGTGGIVRAYNSHFVNNWRSIGFMQYRDTLYSRDASEVLLCTFTVDTNSRQDFLGHISAWDVAGLRIQGCTFEDKRTDKPGSSYGIYTLAASMHVTPDPILHQRNHFEGLARGIELGSDPTRYSWIIDQADFVDNWRGVIVRADEGVQVIRSDFQIGEYPQSTKEPYGLGFLRRGGFVVEQNRFRLTPSSNIYKVKAGLWIDDCGASYNRVRNDTFDQLTFANIVHGENGDDPNVQAGGLQYHCNHQTGNSYDMSLWNSAQYSYGTRVALNQGSINEPARNTFSYPLLTNFGEWHFNNDASGMANVEYWIPLNSTQVQEPTDIFNVRVNRSSSDGSSNFCVERYDNLNFASPQLSGNTLLLADLKQQYQNAVAACQYEEGQNPCDTAAVALKAQEVAYWAGQVVHYYQNDSVPHWDSTLVWLQKVPGLQAQYEVAQHYWKQGRYTEALTYLNGIPSQYTLSTLAQNNHNDYMALKDLLYGAYQSNRNEALLTSGEVDILGEVAQRDYGFAAVEAANIINFFYYYEYTYQPTLPEAEEEERLEEPALTSGLALYPNPSKTWADVRYELPQGAEGTLIITAVNGRVVQEINLTQTKGVVHLNTKDWLTGIYFVALVTEETIQHQKTLIIKR